MSHLFAFPSPLTDRLSASYADLLPRQSRLDLPLTSISSVFSSAPRPPLFPRPPKFSARLPYLQPAHLPYCPPFTYLPICLFLSPYLVCPPAHLIRYIVRLNRHCGDRPPLPPLFLLTVYVSLLGSFLCRQDFGFSLWDSMGQKIYDVLWGGSDLRFMYCPI